MQQVGDTGLHLTRGLVGEGDGDDMPRRYPVILDEPGDLFGDDGGLAAARTGQYQQWAIDVLYSGFLLRVQIGPVRECDTEYFISGRTF
jgi:hypothetical protein